MLVYTWLNKTTGAVIKAEVQVNSVMSGDFKAPKNAGNYKLTVAIELMIENVSILSILFVHKHI